MSSSTIVAESPRPEKSFIVPSLQREFLEADGREITIWPEPLRLATVLFEIIIFPNLALRVAAGSSSLKIWYENQSFSRLNASLMLNAGLRRILRESGSDTRTVTGSIACLTPDTAPSIFSQYRSAPFFRHTIPNSSPRARTKNTVDTVTRYDACHMLTGKLSLILNRRAASCNGRRSSSVSLCQTTFGRLWTFILALALVQSSSTPYIDKAAECIHERG